MELLKESKAKKGSIRFYVKIFFNNETKKYSVYANNTNFNWGHCALFDTLEEAQNDYYNTIRLYDYYDWEEVK